MQCVSGIFAATAGGHAVRGTENSQFPGRPNLPVGQISTGQKSVKTQGKIAKNDRGEIWPTFLSPPVKTIWFTPFVRFGRPEDLADSM